MNLYYEPEKQKEPEKSEMNISECLKDSKLSNAKVDPIEITKEKKLNKTTETSQILSQSIQEKTEVKEDQNELMKIVTEDQINQLKIVKSFENSNSNSKESRDSLKAFNAFKGKVSKVQSQTMDQKDKRNDSLNSPSPKSISPNVKAKKKGEAITRNKTEESMLQSIHNMSSGIRSAQGNRRKPNKSNSNERSKSKKKSASKERSYQRPKTSKGNRKQGKFSNRILVVNLIANPFAERPNTVFENYKKGRISKFSDREKPKKFKGNKSTRGGTPAPVSQNRNVKPGTTLAITASAPGFIDRSISNDCVNSSRFGHHTNHGKMKKTGGKQSKKLTSNNTNKNAPRMTKS